MLSIADLLNTESELPLNVEVLQENAFIWFCDVLKGYDAYLHGFLIVSTVGGTLLSCSQSLIICGAWS